MPASGDDLSQFDTSEFALSWALDGRLLGSIRGCEPSATHQFGSGLQSILGTGFACVKLTAKPRATGAIN